MIDEIIEANGRPIRRIREEDRYGTGILTGFGIGVGLMLFLVYFFFILRIAIA
jgi:hypothetical protein